MAEEKSIVKIGTEYKKAFDSLYVLLLKNSALGKEQGAEANCDGFGRKVISTPTHDYIYDESKRTGESQVLSMGADGASWFAPIRQGKAVGDGTGKSDWEQLISNVAQKFHKTHSIIEYKECGNDNRSDTEKSEQTIRKVIARLFDGLDVVLSKNEKNHDTQDIYGAHVKLELECTGQAYDTVMCKIYFLRTLEKEVRPIAASEASIVTEKLDRVPFYDENEPCKSDENENKWIIEVTLHAMEKLVEDVQADEKLADKKLKLYDFLCFNEGDSTDMEALKDLTECALHNSKPITCSSIKVLSISHVKWVYDNYDVIFRGKPILRAMIGFDGSVSLRCINCENEEELISSNEIGYSFKGENGENIRRSITIKPEEEDLGLTDEMVEEIGLYSKISKHIKRIDCPNVPRLGKGCFAFVCVSQTVCDETGQNVKCANCPYPEEVYTDYSGDQPKRYFTSDLKFAVDKMAMVPEDVKNCACCNRPFTSSVLSHDMCPLCSEIDTLSDGKKIVAEKTYRKYRNALAQTTRVRHLFHKKYCLEDDTVLLFALGNDKYVLSKLDLAKTGYIDTPKKIGRR